MFTRGNSSEMGSSPYSDKGQSSVFSQTAPRTSMGYYHLSFSPQYQHQANPTGRPHYHVCPHCTQSVGRYDSPYQLCLHRSECLEPVLFQWLVSWRLLSHDKRHTSTGMLPGSRRNGWGDSQPVAAIRESLSCLDRSLCRKKVVHAPFNPRLVRVFAALF